jgi:hypothetical protein
MRLFPAALELDAELHDGGTSYRVERVHPPSSPSAFGHAWVRRAESG